jgi:IS30 family transposase
MGLMKDNKITKKKIKHITFDERIIIEHYYKQWKSYSFIAKQIWKNRKSVRNEVYYKWYYNKFWKLSYKAKYAQQKTYRNRFKANRRHTKLLKPKNRWFVEYIKEKMGNNDWSIDAIIGELKNNKNNKKKVVACTSTIYRYAQNHDKELLRMRLTREYGYKKRKLNYTSNSKIRELEIIDNREAVINNRERIWDYEIDLVVSWRWWKTVLLTVIERRTMKIFVKKVKDKTKESVSKAIREIFKNKKVYSITTDNWTEFTDLIDICKELWIKWYRCHPYSSWEKWLIELHNRYIRRYIPKWVNIWEYSDEYIANIVDKINNLPRKSLWYKTPNDLYWKD